MGTLAVVSYRLGGRDGVSIEAAKWMAAFRSLGHTVYTVAGVPPADVVVNGLAIRDPQQPDPAAVAAALAPAGVVVVENLLSLLHLNPAAGSVVAAELRGRPALIHHHDVPWVRPDPLPWPATLPDDPSWRHVTINRLNRSGLASRGIDAQVVYNAFDTEVATGERDATRHALGLAPSTRLLLHPVRAIPRKNIAGALRLARALDATYWLLGAAEDGYETTLEPMLAAARAEGLRVVHGPAGTDAGDRIENAYAAADVIGLPSTWEGFGNAAVESAVHRRPLAIGDYPVADELRAFGFRWFAASDPTALRSWLEDPDSALLDHNQEVARRYFSVAGLPGRLAPLLAPLLEGRSR